jgi:metal-responsive CopG/Arc/MetJ family transcriptional regulator
MNAKRTHVVLSGQLVRDIDTIVGKRRRSSFLTQAAEHELMRLRQIQALETAAGSWKDKDHPELKQGAAKWVTKLRRDYDRRVKNVTTR